MRLATLRNWQQTIYLGAINSLYDKTFASNAWNLRGNAWAIADFTQGPTRYPHDIDVAHSDKWLASLHLHDKEVNGSLCQANHCYSLQPFPCMLFQSPIAINQRKIQQYVNTINRACVDISHDFGSVLKHKDIYLKNNAIH